MRSSLWCVSKMSVTGDKFSNVCRTCLGGDRLFPIFARPEHSERYTIALFFVTGLRIEKQDGLPQTICRKCVSAVNRATVFRNLSHRSEMTLIQSGRKSNGVRLRQLEYNETPVKHQNVEDEYEHTERERKTKSHIVCTMEVIHNHDNKRGENNYLETADKKMELKPNGETIKKVAQNESFKKLLEGQTGGIGPFVCTICKKHLKSWNSFRTHAKIHLGFDFLCEHCGKSFVAVTMLQRHRMSRHGAERTYCCTLCDHRATDSERLKIHERKAHTGERPYVCDACCAGFLTRRHLIHHLAVHATRRIVQCPLCLSTFKSTQHLASHTSKVHRRRSLTCCRGDTHDKLDGNRRRMARAHSHAHTETDRVPPKLLDSETRIQEQT